LKSYVITSPVYPKRTWTLKAFRKGIEALKPAPEAVGIVTSQEVFREYFADNNLFVFVAVHPYYKIKLDRIAKSRSMLKEWFMAERDETYQWWIDSDIEVREDTYRKIHDRMAKLNCLMFSNGYQGRNSTRNWHGIGCTVIHRDVVDLGRFYIPRIRTDENAVRHICEDMMYFSPYHYASHAVVKRLKPEYDRLHVEESIAPVKHHLDERSDHPDYEYKINKRHHPDRRKKRKRR